MKRTTSCTQAEFLRAVDHHRMEIANDNGIYRHVRFRNPETIQYWFDLVTWPGHLCINGDMGTYVFARLQDMFQFFRTDRLSGPEHINPSYWAEKIQAYDKNGKIQEYSYDIFKQIVQEIIDEAETTKAQRDAVTELIKECDGESEEFVHTKVRDCEEFDFTDFWEHNLKEYTCQYMWCCHAIAWGISTYDTFKESQTVSNTEEN